MQRDLEAARKAWIKEAKTGEEKLERETSVSVRYKHPWREG
jgi:hypothetical protein